MQPWSKWESLALRRREKIWDCFISRASRSKRLCWWSSKKMSKTMLSGQHFQSVLSFRKFFATAPVARLYSDLDFLTPVIFCLAILSSHRLANQKTKLMALFWNCTCQIIYWWEWMKWERINFCRSLHLRGWPGQLFLLLSFPLKTSEIIIFQFVLCITILIRLLFGEHSVMLCLQVFVLGQ